MVFFDEMDALFRTRGSGISSDVETTIVPQLLAEIDGVEHLRNVIVIGASNRQDLIDPAILRPGRLDVKIKIERPDGAAAVDIFNKYMTADLPIHEDELRQNGGDVQAPVDRMIAATVEEMYNLGEENRFLEVTYANGDKEVLYFKDFSSGAMIESIVRRAKKLALKRYIQTGEKGIRIEDLLNAVREEFKENEDLPNTTNPDDWAKIAGKKGERIVYVKPLMGETKEKQRDRRDRSSTPASICRNRTAAGASRPAAPHPPPAVAGCCRRRASHRPRPGLHGASEGDGNRDRVRHHGQESARLQPDPVLAPADQLLRDLSVLPHPLGLRGGEPAARRARLRVHAEDKDVPSKEESRLINLILSNGARFYVDHAHPEYSSPETTNPRDCVIWDRAGERILDLARTRAEAVSPPEQRILIYKNNTDSKGNSYGTHENYLMDRKVPFARIVQHLMPFFVSRQIYCGAGKVGAENNTEHCDFQISQRADFLETEVGLETMHSRPIINTRDEPHADPEKYRRLHVIVGDANMSEVSTYLKCGTMAHRAAA